MKNTSVYSWGETFRGDCENQSANKIVVVYLIVSTDYHRHDPIRADHLNALQEVGRGLQERRLSGGVCARETLEMRRDGIVSRIPGTDTELRSLRG